MYLQQNFIMPQTLILNQFNIRRLAFFIEKQLKNVIRQHRANADGPGWLDFCIFEFMEDIKSRKSLIEYQFATDDNCIILGICYCKNDPWMWIEFDI